MADLAALAERLDRAVLDRAAIDPLPESVELTLEDAYAIQAAAIARRLARGERRVGVKMGFTSRAKMAQMGVSGLIWGRLTDGMRVEEGGSLSLADYVHPRIEPELAFLLKSPLSGSVSPMEALAAVEAIAPAMEIIDSRYRKFKFDLVQVVADNASASGFVIGSWRSPAIDFSNLGLVMSMDGRPVDYGSTAAILGHPARSLAAAARLAGEAGETLEAGWIVMAGGATSAHALTLGAYVELEVQSLGFASVSVTE